MEIRPIVKPMSKQDLLRNESLHSSRLVCPHVHVELISQKKLNDGNYRVFQKNCIFFLNKLINLFNTMPLHYDRQ